MLSQTEYQYIKDFLLTQYNSDYRYYVCHTRRVTNYNQNNYNLYDITCRLSKTPITVSNYTFNFPSNDNLLCNIDSTAYSNNNTINKLSCSSSSGGNYTVDGKEYIYSSIGIFPDFLADYRTSLNNHLDINVFMLIPLILTVGLIVKYLTTIFKGDR